MLKIDRLCKSYGDKQVLNELSLEIKKGEIFGFVGPNGAGKTTTLKIISGLLPADSGEIFYEYENLLDNIPLLKSKIGYMPDFFGVYDNLKISEYLEFYGSAYGLSQDVISRRSSELLDLVKLSDAKNLYVDNLSRGMKQRLCLARTLIHNPDIIILDEPASGLDPHTRSDLKEILKNLSEYGKLIIVSSHILTELSQMCTNVGIIDGGRIIMSGKVSEILNQVDESNPIIINIIYGIEKAIEILKENPMVKTLTIDENDILITFLGNKDDEALLLKTLITNDVHIFGFKREQSSLENLFMKITGE